MLRRLATIALLVALTGCSGQAAPDENRSTAVPAPKSPSEDFAEMQSRWWTWAASRPMETNPVADPTGAQCANDQPADVWFLAGTFGGVVERECQVPAGRPLAGPAVNVTANVRADCEQFMADANGTVTLNGEPVPVRRVDPVPISFQAKRGNPVTNSAGKFDVHGCGVWFSIPALPAGEHVVVISGNSGEFTVKATYRLTVSAAD